MLLRHVKNSLISIMEASGCSEETYLGTSRNRPPKLEISGNGDYCCIPQCKSSTLDRNGAKTGIGFFTFPKDSVLRRSWERCLKNIRKDKVHIKRNTKVCEFHFSITSIKCSVNGKKCLNPGSVPSIFDFKPTDKKSRKIPAKRIVPYETEHSSSSTEFTSSESEDLIDNDVTSNTSDNYEQLKQEVVKLRNENEQMKSDLITVRKELQKLTAENVRLESEKFNYKNVSEKPEQFQKTTGIAVSAFEKLYEFLDPGENCENIILSSSDNNCSSKNQGTLNKQGPKPKLNGREQLFMSLVWFRNGFPISHMSYLFQTPKSTISRWLICWINFMYFSLGQIPTWPSRKEVDETMPKPFQKSYPSTRCVIDCTELYCQRPSSLIVQSSLYSSYKHHVTYKGLIGIAPSGATTFVSQLYPGSTSDKEIVQRCGILQQAWDYGDSCMADRGFLIKEDLTKIGVELNIPSFLDGWEQLDNNEVIESQTIASVRIHVERAIQRIKKFRIVRNEIPLVMHGSINQIWTVAALLCNIMPPLIVKDT